ncbi:hypothetical protein [Spirobacillus cienkowskii]|jgi:hypothetical protein|uniref:Uncharacterized protein n=1 Tax=Spirobacillus cienkowskii TaxID=495820 RepID=A0A369KPB2_9BACT|nr:MAG: hypothetical protein DCC88_04335 [Spirobacillus cienkowskii]
MQRIDASKLICALLSPEVNFTIKVILSDNPIYKKIVEEKIFQHSKKMPNLFYGKSAVVEYVEYAATGTLFFAQQSSIVCLPEKLTAKQWEEEKIHLSRLILPLESSAYFFAATSYRNIIKETDFKNCGSVFLCYEPSDAELFKAVEQLASRYSFIASKGSHDLSTIVHSAIEAYSGDLVACDMHFSQMARSSLNFADVFIGSPNINGFHVVDAIVNGDPYLIELRLQQCEACGEDATSVFMALVYFLKQVCAVASSLEDTKNHKLAFEQAKIPFPAQARIQKALKQLQKEKLVEFFSSSAKTELMLRTQKNAHKWLAAELIKWLKNF